MCYLFHGDYLVHKSFQLEVSGLRKENVNGEFLKTRGENILCALVTEDAESLTESEVLAICQGNVTHVLKSTLTNVR